ncbi:MAG: hypothetical protein E6J89_07085 [Deltaproteobacteria bacterium]|nr:MAG: hypothetical protein E6J89_07085 [Deltaproteobacteria bacterium]
MKTPVPQEEQCIDRVKGVGAIILGVSENRNWIELLYEGDLMHTKKIELPSDTLFDIFVEEIPHKSTIYEYPRTLIYLDGPCDLELVREGNKVIVRGCQTRENESLKS